MRCPGFLCGSILTEVIRTIDRSLFIRRVRECKKCGLRFITEERKIEKKSLPVAVLKEMEVSR